MTTYEPELVEVADDSPEAIYALLDARGLGDGLPLVPPTEARVAAMLEHSDGDPDEVLFTLQPRAGIATRRVVAINAVLAGCPPEVFPVVLTALRALAQPQVNLRGVNATTHLVAPLVLVHGEIAKTAGFHGGVGAFGPGNRANATVGRAVRLAMLHVGGAKPGFGDAATHGQPAKYTFCAAENIDESPWESYPRSRGVDAPSAVTVHCGEGPHNVHDAEASGDPALILDKVASAMTSLGQNNAPISQGEYFIVLGPEHAQSIALHGYDPTRRAVVSLRARPHPCSCLPAPLPGAGVGAVDEDGRRRPPASDDRRRRQHPGARGRWAGQALPRDSVVGHDQERHAPRAGLRSERPTP